MLEVRIEVDDDFREGGRPTGGADRRLCGARIEKGQGYTACATLQDAKEGRSGREAYNARASHADVSLA